MKLSVVIPCYEMSHFVGATLESVAAQTTPVHEIIVVEDGSTVPCNNEIEKFAKQYPNILLHYIENPTNCGLAAARNIGIQKASGEWIIPLDADNLLAPQANCILGNLIKKGLEFDVLYGKRQNFQEDESVVVQGGHSLSEFLVGNTIDACAFYRKSVWELVGGYDPHMPHQGHEDWLFWIDCVVKGIKFEQINEILFHYRVRADSMLRSGDVFLKHQEAQKYIFGKHASYLAEQFQKEAKDFKLLKIEFARNQERLSRIFDFPLIKMASKIKGFLSS